ncbi:MmoB/DmpM family protein [Sphingomonas sp. SRS2]|uniref:MmoB/DmpM family protein n=1 Tax=Sphingomonas sp. SRS2 TaxID=133190 RepID=UPI0006184CA6|nr:MmoB/DmpM family protein [Sphingomonas sp. SRS2]KKC24299.1 monooxygenase [Sphingomonas sp. SRS2]
MSGEESFVFLALQANDDTRPVIEAILADNPHAKLDEQPAMVRIHAKGSLRVRRASIEELVGRPFDLQELHINMITLSGHIDETDDALTLSWERR